jgi:hypothetical protein
MGSVSHLWYLRFLASTLVAVSLYACENLEPYVAKPSERTYYEFQCDEGKRLSVRLTNDNQKATIKFGDREADLLYTGVTSGVARRYDGEGMILILFEEKARVEQSGAVLFKNCTAFPLPD